MNIKINVIGLGFVGLTSALGFAKKKFDITGVEIDKKKLLDIKNNKLPFFEPHLKERLIIENNRKFLKFHNSVILEEKKINVVFICVGTPSKKDGSANLEIIKSILKESKKKHNKKKIIFVIKSTVPPGTYILLKKIIANVKNFHLSTNPEFLREGFAWKDFFNSGKIVIGCENISSQKVLKYIYRSFNDKKVYVNNSTAEFIKYLSNTLLANLISFSNDMTIFAEKFKNINVKQSFDSIKMDSRWNGNPAPMISYINPGIGYGGYCLPKDTKALYHVVKKIKKNHILKRIINVNNEILDHQVKKIIKIPTKKIFILGLSFKPGSDDIRESKSILLIKKLITNDKKTIYAADPVCSNNVKKIFKNKVKILKKPKIIKDTTYILATPWDDYIKFIKKNKKIKYLDLRYLI